MSDFSCHPTGGRNVITDLFYHGTHICFSFVYGTWEAVTKLVSHAKCGKYEPLLQGRALCTECTCARVHVWTHMYACLCFCLCVFMVKKTAEARKSIKFPTPPGTHRSSPVSTATGKADLKEPMAHCISKTTKRPSQHLSTQPSAPSVRRWIARRALCCSQPSSPHPVISAKLAMLHGAVCLGLILLPLLCCSPR